MITYALGERCAGACMAFNVWLILGRLAVGHPSRTLALEYSRGAAPRASHTLYALGYPRAEQAHQVGPLPGHLRAGSLRCPITDQVGP